MISIEHAQALCELVSEIPKFQNCNHPIFCKLAPQGGCVVWHNIDPFKRKLLEIKYKEKNERNSIK